MTAILCCRNSRNDVNAKLAQIDISPKPRNFHHSGRTKSNTVTVRKFSMIKIGANFSHDTCTLFIVFVGTKRDSQVGRDEKGRIVSDNSTALFRKIFARREINERNYSRPLCSIKRSVILYYIILFDSFHSYNNIILYYASICHHKTGGPTF